MPVKTVKLSQCKYIGVNRNNVVLNEAPKGPSIIQVSSCKEAFLQV